MKGTKSSRCPQRLKLQRFARKNPATVEIARFYEMVKAVGVEPIADIVIATLLSTIIECNY